MIPEIRRQKDLLSQKFLIHDCLNGKYTLIAEEIPFTQHYGNIIRIEIDVKRLEKLAQDILAHLGKKSKFESWNPTIGDWQIKMEEQYRKGDALYMWFIDWVREVVTMKEVRVGEYKELIRIYEWIKGNEKWLYGENK